jgi:hypothetical protein
MRTATKWLLAFVLIAPLGMTAQAQTAADTAQVTFQVDLSQPIAAGAFMPDTDEIEIRGSFNNFSAGNPLDRVGTTDVYSTTIALAKGDTVEYKFYSPAAPVGWENNIRDEVDASFDTDNRDYIVADQDAITLDAVPFNKEFAIASGTQAYRITFVVDMSVAALNESTFNPDDGDFVVVAGGCQPDSFQNCLNGWDRSADTLRQDFFNPNLYSKTIEIPDFPVPADGDRPQIGYKFVIGTNPGSLPEGWEGGDNRMLTLPTDGAGADGFIELTSDTTGALKFYNRIDDSGIFTEEAEVIFEVDLRPAFYYLADNGNLPNDTQTGQGGNAEITTVALNGPAAGRALSNTTGIGDWADWGATLSQIPARNFVDDGTGADAVAGDSIYTQTFSYGAGTPTTLVGKFGANGFDNEAGFGGDTNFFLRGDDGNRVRATFGAVRLADSTYTDQRGPSSDGDDYDPYLVISSDSMSVTVVRSGGQATSVEPGAGAPNGAFVLGNAMPNPSSGLTRFSYELARAGAVQLSIYDLQGREVARLFEGTQGVGTYDVSFDASNLSAGIYLYRLAAGGEVATSQLVVVR